MVGQKWSESVANALVLGWGIFIFILKGYHLGFCKKHFAATWTQIIGNVERIGEMMKMVYRIYQFAGTRY